MSSIPCPSCGTPLPPRPLSCPACGLRLTGPDAARLWEVDQALEALRTERVRLLAALAAPVGATTPSSAPLTAAHTVGGPTAAGRGATPTTTPAPAGTPTAPATTGPPAMTFPPGPSTAFPTGPGPSTSPARRTWSTQQTLLAVGALLVLVAGSIALAVAWFVIGRWGQVLVMGGLTALASWAALLLSRRRLPSTAEAVAVVAGGLMLLDVSAARRFGLAGLDQVDLHAYTAVSALLVAVLLGVLHQRDHRVAAFGILSLTAASVSWGAVVSAPDHLLAAAALALLGGALFGALHLVLPSSWGVVRRAATGPAAAWVLLGSAAAGVEAAQVQPGEASGTALLADLLLLLVAVLGAVVVAGVVRARAGRLGARAAVRADWVARWFTGDWRAVGVVAAVASVTAPFAVLSLAVQLSPVAAAGLGVLLAAAVVAVVAVQPLGHSVGQRWLEAQSAGAVAAVFLATLAHDSQPAQAFVLAGVAVAAVAVAVLRPGWRGPASGTAAASGLTALWLTADLVGPTTTALTVAVAGLALVAAALTRPGRPEELPVGAVGALALATALAQAVSQGLDTPVLVAVLACGTAAGTATAVLRPALRSAATAVTALLGTLLVREVGLLVSAYAEWASVMLAALVLAGLAAWRRRRPEELVLGGFALAVGVAALTLGLDRGLTHSSAAAAVLYAVAALAYAVPPGRRAVVLASVASATTAAWVELWHADVTTLEAYTLPPAALLLAAGLWSADLLGRRSWLVAGPGLVLGLVPSALDTAVDDSVARPLLTVTVAVVVLVAGAWRRWQALVVVGAFAAVVVAVTQLGPYAVHLPRFLTLGTLGVALLAVGARYEQRRTDARRAMSWLASLS